MVACKGLVLMFNFEVAYSVSLDTGCIALLAAFLACSVLCLQHEICILSATDHLVTMYKSSLFPRPSITANTMEAVIEGLGKRLVQNHY